jgi:hypothetical protein
MKVQHRVKLIALSAFALVVVYGPGILRPVNASQKGGVPAVNTRVEQLEQLTSQQAGQIEALTLQLQASQQTIAQLVTRIESVERKTAPIGIDGDNLTISGVNVFIIDGSGSTRSDTGLGNLTIGYNEPRPQHPVIRTGSHNLVVGEGHNYSASGGVVFGFWNVVTEDCATVTGGIENESHAFCASISGGDNNMATGRYSSISGGDSNVASGEHSSVSGGLFNKASGNLSSVSGGLNREAPGELNWAAGTLLEGQ